MLRALISEEEESLIAAIVSETTNRSAKDESILITFERIGGSGKVVRASKIRLRTNSKASP